MTEKQSVGRPRLAIKRGVRNIRAHDDEWDLILRFAQLVKYHNLEECRRMLEDLEHRIAGDKRK